MTHARRIAGAVMSIVLAVVVSMAADAQADDEKKKQENEAKIKELEKQQAKFQKMIDELRRDFVGAQEKTEAGVLEREKKKAQDTAAAAEVRQRPSFEDRQRAAARLDNLTLDPEYRGFIPIPNTEVLIRFNARPRVDVTWDDGSGDEDRFVTALIPVRGSPDYDGRSQFNINAKASALVFEAVAPDLPGNPRFYYQNDFFGSGGNEYEFRVQHLYGQIYNVIIGQTYSLFEDPDVWPDTVDFEGPNSMIFARYPVLHYQVGIGEKFKLTFGIEQPDSQVPDLPMETVDGFQQMPDFAAQLRWQDKDLGHVQLASIVRRIGADSPTFGKDEVWGWGVNLSSLINFCCGDTILGQVTYGSGIGRYGNDTSFFKTDAAFDMNGRLESLRYVAFLGAYTHNWSDDFRSTVSYGWVDLNTVSTMGPDAYDTTQYASANLIYQMRERFAMGVEVLWGDNEVRDGDSGSLWRVQYGIRYSLF